MEVLITGGNGLLGRHAVSTTSSAAAVHSATGDTPTKNTPRQARCMPTKGSTRRKIRNLASAASN